MHEYRRFIQGELDARGWKQADLVRRSGLSRQLVSSLMRDSRDHLGQMPDAATIEALAFGFGVSVDIVRTAAARSLADYVDDGTALTITLSEVSTDALLTEIRRRIDHGVEVAQEPDAPSETEQDQKTDQLANRRRRAQQPQLVVDDLPPDIADADAARNEPGIIKTGDRVQHLDDFNQDPPE